jgi:hypothetical protein
MSSLTFLYGQTLFSVKNKNENDDHSLLIYIFFRRFITQFCERAGLVPITMVEQRCVLLLAVLAAGFESSHAASDTYGRYDYDR